MDTEPYLIWSNEHKCWGAADSKGYRTKLEDAGRYSREDALGICTGARGGRQYNDNPSEVPILLSDARAFWADDKEEWTIARRNFREDRERDMLRAYSIVLDDGEDA